MARRSGRDPRDIVTPDAFHVDPALLGRPLATPLRRAAAMAIDLPLVGVLVLLGGVVFAIGLAYALWRMTRRRRGIFARRAAVWTARGMALGVLALAAVSAVGPPGPDEDAGAVTSPGDIVGLVTEGAIVLRARSPAETRRAARSVARTLAAEDEDPAEIAALFEELGRDLDLPAWKRSILREEAAAITGGPRPADRPDSLAVVWASMRASGDTVGADALREELAEAVAEDTVAALAEQIDRLDAARAELEQQVVQAREGFSVIRLIENAREDLGLGFGWLALYFTGFLAVWRGQSPGKRLLGVRVVKLGGGRLTWWDSFSRFGGYAASVATGLLGFVQILWDANRQGLHDRIAGTVVVREGGEAAPERAHEWREIDPFGG